jgi:hypothetical protein
MSPKYRKPTRASQELKNTDVKPVPTGLDTQPEAAVPANETKARWEHRLELWLPLFLGLVFFVLYILTAAPSVPAGDSGELISAAWNLGIAHQPGYPTFTMLSRLAGFLPVGNPAFRLNLLSALLDAVALGILCWGILRFLRAEQDKLQSRLVPVTGAIAGAGLLAVSTLFWLYSTVAEVFALNNLFAVIALVLMMEWVRQPARKKFLYLGGLFSGLALTNQLTFVLLAPGLLTLLAGGLVRWRNTVRSGMIAGKSKKRDPGWLLNDLAITAGLLILGFLPYIYLPIAASANPPVNWGNPSTFSSFWQVLTRSDYGTFSFTANSAQGNPLQQLYYLGLYFLHSFRAVGILLALLGIIWFAQKRRLEGAALGLAFLFSGPLFAIFANPQLEVPLTRGVFERFYILPSIPVAFFTAAGAVFLIELAVKAAAKLKTATVQHLAAAAGMALTAAMVIIMAVVNFSTVNISNNRMVEYYANDLLEPLEPNALLIMNHDYNGTAVMYAQLVEGLRPDVIALHAEMLKAPWYVQEQVRLHPEITIPFTYYDRGKNSFLADLVKSNIDRRPVYTAGIFDEDLSASYDEVYWGMTRRLVKKGEGPDSFALMKTESDRFAGLKYPDKVYPLEYWESSMAEQYGQAAFIIAVARSKNEAQPDADSVAQLYRIAILNNPVNPSAYKNLGILLWKNSGPPAEIIEMWEKYLQMVPDDPNKADLLQVMAKLKEKQ